MEAKTIRLSFNPHIRGIKAGSSNKLSERGKNYYDLLYKPKEDETAPDTNILYRSNKTKFSKIELSPVVLKKRTASEKKFYPTSKSPIKEPLLRKKNELSINEQDEVDEIITKRLDSEYQTVRKTIERKIKKLSQHKIFSEEIYTLRTISLAAVHTKRM